MEKNTKVKKLTDLMGIVGSKGKEFIIDVNADNPEWLRIVRVNKALGIEVWMSVSEEFAASLYGGGELAEMRIAMVNEHLDKAEARLLSESGRGV